MKITAESIPSRHIQRLKIKLNEDVNVDKK